MYDSLVKSTIFSLRNTDKVLNSQNDQGRILADVGQFTNAAKAAAHLDNAIGKGAQAAISAMGTVAQNNKFLESAAKGANWAANHVNPLLIGAAGYRVLTSEDKETALKKEVLGMSSMFATESLMKQVFESCMFKNMKNKIKNKYLSAGFSILQGLLFVAGSIGGSAAGYKFGDLLINEKNVALNKSLGITDYKLPASADIKPKFEVMNRNKSEGDFVDEDFIPGRNQSVLG